MKSRNYRIFKKWLKLNRVRFNFNPYILNVRKHSFNIAFTGVTNVTINVSKDHFSIWRNTHDDPDWIGDIDLPIPTRGPKGYGCSACTDSKIYRSKLELLYEHTYEEFLLWCNDNL